MSEQPVPLATASRATTTTTTTMAATVARAVATWRQLLARVLSPPRATADSGSRAVAVVAKASSPPSSAALLERAPVAWMAGTMTLLAVAYALAPGRHGARDMALPRVCRFHVADAPRNAARARLRRRRSAAGKFTALLRVAVPSLRSREVALIVAQTCLMLVRAALSVAMARATGRLATAAVRGHARALFAALARFALLFSPAAVLDATLKYLREVQELRFRANVARYLATRYLRAKVFYRLAGLREVDLIDQRLTDDVQRWTAVSSAVFTSVTRPLVEAVAFSLVLARRTRWRGVALSWGYYLAYAGIAACAAPNMDWMLTQRQEREGALRACHQRVRAHATEVAVLRGYAAEAAQLRRRFAAIADFARYAAFVHARYNLLETLYTKQGSVLVFYAIAALALLGSNNNNSNNSNNSHAHDGGGAVLSSSEMLSQFGELSFAYKTLAKAIGRLLWNIRLVFAINGYTQRLYQLVEALDAAEYDVAAAQAEQQQQQQQSHVHANGHATMPSHQQQQQEHTDAVTTTSQQQQQHEQHRDNDNDDTTATAATTLPPCGQLRRGDHIAFIDVPLTLPTGDVLCAALSFYVKPGMNLLIVGPNGCGKTSTFRLLGELWPLRGGCIVKPARSQMYYVPQRPYLYDGGTLAEQILYPTPRARARDVSEAVLYDCVQRAGLDGLLRRPHVSWSSRLPCTSNSSSDDNDDGSRGSEDDGGGLSAGEKQRLAMARLFYHRPRFAILDECSSTLDHDLEARFYAQCRELGITVLTIAHRRSVWRYHNWILYFDGAGGYMFSPLRLEWRDTTHSSNSKSDDNVAAAAATTDKQHNSSSSGGSGDEASSTTAAASALVLTRVVSASDATRIGSEVRVPVAGLWRDDDDDNDDNDDDGDAHSRSHGDDSSSRGDCSSKSNSRTNNTTRARTTTTTTAGAAVMTTAAALDLSSPSSPSSPRPFSP